MVTYKYVIINDCGQFYWKGNVSSLYGFKDDFDDAYLFKTEKSANQRIKSLNTPNLKVGKVKVEFIED